MNNIQLPLMTQGRPVPSLPPAAQLTIVGAPGAGKSKFMEAMINLNSKRSYCLSAVSAPFPERVESKREGSIDMLFRKATSNRAYMRNVAVSELEKLCYLLITDEFDRLMELKEKFRQKKDRKVLSRTTRLDRLADLWERLYPGNRIVRSGSGLLFSTSSGSDLIGIDKLSQGEQTAFYYAAALLFAMPGAVVFIDSPSLFLHPTILTNLWNAIEDLRPDCRFVYNSVDVEFVGSRSRNVCVWVKSYDASSSCWDYEIIEPGEFHEEVFVDLLGSRRPVLFIEGDSSHSIDSRLYPLVFPEWTVKPLGSCNKVIEATRTFSDMKNLHHLSSRGIVDRDRRTDHEVDYLRKKSVMVPEVAEVENLFLLEGVIKVMAKKRGKKPDVIFNRVKKKVLKEFLHHYPSQALQHTRYRIKREVEYKVDMRFSCITAMESHLQSLFIKLSPRKKYNTLLREFRQLIENEDYNGVLKVFNHKPMLSESGVAKELGYKNTDDYITGVINVLKENSKEGNGIRDAIKDCFIKEIDKTT